MQVGRCDAMRIRKKLDGYLDVENMKFIIFKCTSIGIGYNSTAPMNTPITVIGKR